MTVSDFLPMVQAQADRLAAHGYEGATVRRLADDTFVIDAVSPSGIRIRLASLSDVEAAVA